jgi:hypothetical protein
MHILLIEADVKRIAPNLAMLKFATWAEKNGHSFQYIIGYLDKNLRPIIPKTPPDLVVMSCIFSFYSADYANCLRHYKNLFNKAKFLVGGPFPTLNPMWFKENLPFVEVHQGIYPEIENLPLKYSIAPWSNKIVGYASRG